MQLKLFEFKENVKRREYIFIYGEAMNIELASNLQPSDADADADTHMLTQTHGTFDGLPVCGPKSFRQSKRSFYNIRSDILCVAHSCWWTMGRCGRKENNDNKRLRKEKNKTVRSMLHLNRTLKYENKYIESRRRRRRRSQKGERSQRKFTIHCSCSEVHTNASCNRFIDWSLSRLSQLLFCFILFWKLKKVSGSASVWFDLSCTHRYLYQILIAYLFRYQFVYSNHFSRLWSKKTLTR